MGDFWLGPIYDDKTKTEHSDSRGFLKGYRELWYAMKIYILRTEADYDNSYKLYGVYSSKDRAIEAIPFLEAGLGESDIEEIELDPPNESEPYEPIFLAIAYTDGTTWESPRVHKIKRSELESWPELGDKHLSFSYSTGLHGYVGYAETQDGAMSNARAGLSLLRPVWRVSRYSTREGFNETHEAHPSRVSPFALFNTAYAVHEDLEAAKRILVEYEATGKIQPGLFYAK